MAASVELEVLQRHSADLTSAIATNPSLFGQYLVQCGVAVQATVTGIVNTLGVSDYHKGTQLLGLVDFKVRTAGTRDNTRKYFNDFLMIIAGPMGQHDIAESLVVTFKSRDPSYMPPWKRDQDHPPRTDKPTPTSSGLPDVEVGAETTLVVTSDPQHFIWEGYGLKVHIPQGSLQESVDKCTIKIQASLFGQYEFPENSFLVSGVFWFKCEPQCKFLVSISVEIQHCARTENTPKLSFVKAYCSQKSLPYTFRTITSGLFSNSSSYGILELDSFSGVAVTQEGSEEREYVARLFYLSQSISNHAYDVHLVVTWNTETHLTIVKEDYFKEKRALPGPEQPVIFDESKQIKLDIPQTGIKSDGWIITPLMNPVVTKENVDNYKPRKMIPHCELSAEFESDTAEVRVSSLRYQVKLLGAKEPYNMFTIKPPTSTGITWLLVVSLVMCAVAVMVPTALSLTGYMSSQGKSIDNPAGPTPTSSLRNYFPHMNDRPTMDQLIILEPKEGGNPVRIIERLGAQNFEVGTFLLKDNKGVIMDTIRHNARGNAEAMNREMFRRWLAGSGASVSWKVLVDTLDRYRLKALADDIVDALHT